jgi:hypothetical protein
MDQRSFNFQDCRPVVGMDVLLSCADLTDRNRGIRITVRVEMFNEHFFRNCGHQNPEEFNFDGLSFYDSDQCESLRNTKVKPMSWRREVDSALDTNLDYLKSWKDWSFVATDSLEMAQAILDIHQSAKILKKAVKNIPSYTGDRSDEDYIAEEQELFNLSCNQFSKLLDDRIRKIIKETKESEQ